MPQIEEWIKNEILKISKKKKRRYLHFDTKIYPTIVANDVSNPEFVKKKSFYPFIRNIVKVIRFKKDPTTNNRMIDKNKTRDLFYASHSDALIYSYYNFILSELYEKILTAYGINDVVLAYRRLDGKCNIHFASEVFDHIEKHIPIVAKTYDVEKFFDSLDHSILLKQWRNLLGVERIPDDHYKVYKNLTNYSYVDRDQLYNALGIKFGDGVKRKRICNIQDFRDKVRGNGLIQMNKNGFGIPQGSPISGLLSNLYMLEFDQGVRALVKKHGGIYRRYSDDIIVLAQNEYIDTINEFIIEKLRTLCELSINQSKTETVNFTSDGKSILSLDEEKKDKMLQYLGFEFDGQRIFIRSRSLSRYYRKMKQRIKYSAIRAKDSKSDSSKIFKRKLYRLYSHLGKNNFVSYAYNASEIMKSKSIKKQISKHWQKLNSEIKTISKSKNIS